MCGCVWRYEASALFLGQLLVTQEWLICNGCCHSPAVAPGDGCAVTNAHALTCSLWRRHTEVQNIHKSALTCKEPGVLVLYQHSFQHLLWKLCFCPFTCEWSCSLNSVLSFLPPEHRGGGEVHPGPDEPHARPEYLLQPVPRDGLRQAKGVQGHLQHGLQVTLRSVIFGEGLWSGSASTWWS